MNSLDDVFQVIYKRNLWGVEETVSGYGSTLEFTANIRKQLPVLLKDLGVVTVLDAGCGDWNWMSNIDLSDFKVWACDIVNDLILEDYRKYKNQAQFFTADITSDALPGADLILCRTVLFHLSNEHIFRALSNFKRCGATWLLMTNHPRESVNVDIPDGSWRRINFQAIPFAFPKPSQSLIDGPGIDGELSLWPISHLAGLI